MSKELNRQLDEASLEVNRVIDNSFDGLLQPKNLYDASRHLINAGGKRLRPFLVLKTCELVGGRRKEALPVAAAIEFIHNFTLIHDDIMDRDDKRRGVPTVHVLWGVPIALVAGDMLFAKAYDFIINSFDLRNVPPKRVLKVLGVMSKATVSVCEGQAFDMMFEERSDVSEMEYIEMIGRKTAALIEASTLSGSIIGGGNALQMRKLGSFGKYAGLAFQIVDDVLGLTANEKVLGKPVGSDLREGKRTIILLHALAKADRDQRKQILSVIGSKEVPEETIKMTMKLIRSLGSVDYAASRADEYVEKAKKQLSSFSSSEARTALLDLCDYIVSRKY
ncbi:MAG: geranylgeranyl diphosphate synthase, type [Thermoproteota archaeon]|nr:geranylgeranyl diphosphate synthase, type [Thermoproteota archaeon]